LTPEDRARIEQALPDCTDQHLVAIERALELYLGYDGNERERPSLAEDREHLRELVELPGKLEKILTPSVLERLDSPLQELGHVEAPHAFKRRAQEALWPLVVAAVDVLRVKVGRPRQTPERAAVGALARIWQSATGRWPTLSTSRRKGAHLQHAPTPYAGPFLDFVKVVFGCLPVDRRPAEGKHGDLLTGVVRDVLRRGRMAKSPPASGPAFRNDSSP
jgi:hypothetical protein